MLGSCGVAGYTGDTEGKVNEVQKVRNLKTKNK